MTSTKFKKKTEFSIYHGLLAVFLLLAGFFIGIILSANPKFCYEHKVSLSDIINISVTGFLGIVFLSYYNKKMSRKQHNRDILREDINVYTSKLLDFVDNLAYGSITQKANIEVRRSLGGFAQRNQILIDRIERMNLLNENAILLFKTSFMEFRSALEKHPDFQQNKISVSLINNLNKKVKNIIDLFNQAMEIA